MSEDTRSTASLAIGAPLPKIKRVITRDMICRYGAMVEGERRNPIHYDQAAAVEAGFPDVIAHGTLSLGFVSQALTEILGAAWLTGSKISAKFIGAVFPGDEIFVHGALRERITEGSRMRLVFDFWCENRSGQKVIVGSATAETGVS